MGSPLFRILEVTLRNRLVSHSSLRRPPFLGNNFTAASAMPCRLGVTSLSECMPRDMDNPFKAVLDNYGSSNKAEAFEEGLPRTTG